jgi:putative ABC transport system ATP-binding protein
MTREPLFTLRNFTQSYGGRTVLRIPELDIRRGEFVVFLGKSGCGKTTLMETLSLMRRPRNVEFNKAQVIFHEDAEHPRDFRDIWRDPNLATRIRSRHFSFMFQDSVFFEDIDIGENLILPRILQEERLPPGVRFRDFLGGLRAWAAESSETLGMAREKLTERINIQSGGQVQRFAFVRSILPDFRVLFADEPTGNLDEANADYIFRRMREFLTEAGDGMTILVVTHQKDLAIRYADRIVCIAENGVVVPQNTFNVFTIDGARVWRRETDDPQSSKNLGAILPESKSAREFSAVLDEVISSPAEPPEKPETPPEPPRKRPRRQAAPRQRLFVRAMMRNRSPDFRFRPTNPYFLVLFFFLAVGLAALGISHLNLKKLERKMKDPYINWLHLYPLMDYDINAMAATLDSTEVRKRFGIDYVGTTARFALYVLPKKWLPTDNPRTPDPVFGETMDFNSVIARKIYDDAKLEYNRPDWADSEKADLGLRDVRLIVTSEMLTSLGYAPDEPFVWVRYGGYDTPIPVMTTVKALPHKNAFLCSPGFYYAKSMENSLIPDIQGTARVLVYDSLRVGDFANVLVKAIEAKKFDFWPGQDDRKVRVESVPYAAGQCRSAKLAVISRLHQKEEWDRFQGIVDEAEPILDTPMVDPLTTDAEFDTAMVSLYDEPEPDTALTSVATLFTPVLHRCALDTLIAKVSQQTGIEARRFFPVKETYAELRDPEFIAQKHNGITIYLGSLDHIRELRAFLMERFHYELSIESVENLENYRSVARITTMLGVSVIVIILMFLAVYVIYILYIHLHKVRRLLGLLLAFGAAPGSLSAVYRRVILGFVVKTLLSALIASYAAYYLYLWVPANRLGQAVPREYLIFYFNPIQIALLVGVVLVSLVSSWIILRRFLRRQPGDLLYDRDEVKR